MDTLLVLIFSRYIPTVEFFEDSVSMIAPLDPTIRILFWERHPLEPVQLIVKSRSIDAYRFVETRSGVELVESHANDISVLPVPAPTIALHQFIVTDLESG